MSSAFAAELADLRERFARLQPELEVTLRDPALGVEGFVVVWNTAISKAGPLPGCAKGGTRIRTGLALDEVRMLARTMAIKNAAAGLPLGGCKSGLCADPAEPGFEARYRRFVALCKPLTFAEGGPFGGFGFDVGAAPEHALWACDELGTHRSFTGKPVHMGGSDYDAEGIAGLGVATAAQTLLELHQRRVAEHSYAVHGVGALGAAVVRYQQPTGARLVALGDPRLGGSWSLPAGASAELADALASQDLERARSLLAREGERRYSDPNAVLTADVDVLFPCALQDAITPQLVDQLRARYIVEGANHPTHDAAVAGIQAAGIHRLPDFIANAGGIIAAYVEMTSAVSAADKARSRAVVAEAKRTTRDTIASNVGRVLASAEAENVDLGDAAMHLALRSILDSAP
ncbi:MAG: Glu/Leu/Phe/Val dehydrogenase dimerization domain-containing protein [Pseudomonadota bacterium]